jgi:hypothetical protein
MKRTYLQARARGAPLNDIPRDVRKQMLDNLLRSDASSAAASEAKSAVKSYVNQVEVSLAVNKHKWGTVH